MKNLTWQNPEQLFVAQELINKVKSKCCGIKVYLNPKSEIADNIHIGFIPMACVDDGFSGNHYFEKRIWKEVKKGYCHFQNGAHRYCKNISML